MSGTRWTGILVLAAMMIVAPAAFAGEGTPADQAFQQAAQVYESIFGENGSLAWLVAGDPPPEMNVIDAPWDATVGGDLGPQDYATNEASGAPYGVGVDGLEGTFTSEGYVRVAGGDSATGIWGTPAGPAATIEHSGGIYAEAGSEDDFGMASAAGIDVSGDGTAEGTSLAVDNSGDILAEMSVGGLWSWGAAVGVRVAEVESGEVTNSGTVFAVGELDGTEGAFAQVTAVSVSDVLEASLANSGTIAADAEVAGGTGDSVDAYGVVLDAGSSASADNDGLILGHASLEDAAPAWTAAVGLGAFVDGEGADVAVTNGADGTIAGYLEGTAEAGGDEGSMYEAMGVFAMAGASADEDAVASISLDNAGTVAAEADLAGYDDLLTWVAGVDLEAQADADSGNSATVSVENTGTIDGRAAFRDADGAALFAGGAYLAAEADGGTEQVAVTNGGTFAGTGAAENASLEWFRVGGVVLRGREATYRGSAGGAEAADGGETVTASLRASSTTFRHDDGSDEDPTVIAAGISLLASDASDVLDRAEVSVGAGGTVSATMALDGVSWENAGEDTETDAFGIHVAAGDGGEGEAGDGTRGVTITNDGAVSAAMTVTDSQDNGASYVAGGILAEVDDSEGMDVSISGSGAVSAILLAGVEDPAEDRVSTGNYEVGGIAALGNIGAATISAGGSVDASLAVQGATGSFDLDGDGTVDADQVRAVVGLADATGILISGDVSGDDDARVARATVAAGDVSAAVSLSGVEMAEVDGESPEIGAHGIDVTADDSISATFSGTVTAAASLDDVTWEDSGQGKAYAAILSAGDEDGDGDGTAATVTATNQGTLSASLSIRNSTGEGAYWAAAGLQIDVDDGDDGGRGSVVNEGTISASIRATRSGEGAEEDVPSGDALMAVGLNVSGDIEQVSVDSSGTISGALEISGTDETPYFVDWAAVAGIFAQGDQVALDTSGDVSGSLVLSNVDVVNEWDVSAEAYGLYAMAGPSLVAELQGNVAAAASVEASDLGVGGLVVYGGLIEAGDDDGAETTISAVVHEDAAVTAAATMGGVTMDGGTVEVGGLVAETYDDEGGFTGFENDGTVAASLAASDVSTAGFTVTGAGILGDADAPGEVAATNSGTISATLSLDGATATGWETRGLRVADASTVSFASEGTIVAGTSLSGTSIAEDPGETVTRALDATAVDAIDVSLDGTVAASTTIDGLAWDDPGHGTVATEAVHLSVTGEEAEGAVAGSLSFLNEGTILAGGSFRDAGSASYLVTGFFGQVAVGTGDTLDFVNDGNISVALTFDEGSSGTYSAYGAYLLAPKVDVENDGTIRVAVDAGSDALASSFGVYLYAPQGATFVNDGTISVTGDGTGCAVCFDGVAGGATFDSAGVIYTGPDVRALSVLGGSQVTLATADETPGTFTWAVAGDPDEIVRPIYVGAGSTLDLNGATFHAYLTPRTDYTTPYWLIEADGTVLGSFGSLEVTWAHPDFGAQLLGSGADTRLQFSYVPRNSSGTISALAGLTTVRHVMQGLFDYQKMALGWQRQVARAARPVQVASLRPYVGTLSPAAAEQVDGRSTVYVRPLYGGRIDASDLGYDADIWGFEMGWRYRVTDRFTLGLFYGYGETDVDLTDSGYQGDHEEQTYDAYGVFGRYDAGPFYGMLAVSRFDVDDEYRGITGTNLDVMERDDFDSDAIDARLEVGWAFDWGKWNLVPNLGFSWTNWQTDPHHTTASDSTWNRYFGDYDEDFSEASLGVDLVRTWILDDNTVTFFGGLKLAEALSGDQTGVAQWIPGMSTPRIEVVQDVSDLSILGNLGVMAQKKNLRLTLGVSGRSNSDYTSFTGYAQVGWRF